MTSRRRKRRFERPLAETLGPEDGVDPREWGRGEEPRPIRNRKALQLCRQVEQALALALPAFADPILQQLTVLGVRPYPDSGRLLVLLRTVADVAVAQLRVRVAAARLRQDVAQAICRRKMPELALEVVPAASGDE